MVIKSFTYDTAHQEVKRLKGVARDHDCEHCIVAPAAGWAYDHFAIEEKKDSVDGYYCFDSMHYLALCYKCHKRMDVTFSRLRAAIRDAGWDW